MMQKSWVWVFLLVLISWSLGLIITFLASGVPTLDSLFYTDLGWALSKNQTTLPYIWQYFVPRVHLDDPGPYFWPVGASFFYSWFYGFFIEWSPLVGTLPLLCFLPFWVILSFWIGEKIKLDPTDALFGALLALFGSSYTFNLVDGDNILLYGTLMAGGLFLIPQKKEGTLNTLTPPLLFSAAAFFRPEGFLALLYGGIYVFLRDRTFKRWSPYLWVPSLFFGVLNLIGAQPILPTSFSLKLKLALLTDYQQIFYWNHPLSFRELIGFNQALTVSWASFENLRTLFTSSYFSFLWIFPLYHWVKKGAFKELNPSLQFTLLNFIIYSVVFPIPGHNGSLFHALSFLPLLLGPFTIKSIRNLEFKGDPIKRAALMVSLVSLSLGINIFSQWDRFQKPIGVFYPLKPLILNWQMTGKIKPGPIMVFEPIPFFHQTGLKAVMIPLNFVKIGEVLRQYKVSLVIWPKHLAPLEGLEQIFKDEKHTIFRVP